MRRRIAMVQALGVAGDHQAVVALLEILEDEHEVGEIRWHAARALGKTGNPRAIPALTRWLDAPDERLRVSSVIGLAGMEGEEAVEPLLSALRSESTTVRSHAAEALARFPREPVVRALRVALEDKKRLVRFYAAKSLAETRDPQMAHVLRDRARRERFVMRRLLRGLADELDSKGLSSGEA